MADKGDWRGYLHERGIEDRTIEHFDLSWDGRVIHIPFEGRVRLYNPWPKKWTNDKGREIEESKMKWVEGDFLDATPPFPSWEALKAAEVLCEGEWDCMLLWQNGFAAATTSAGASTFLEEWADACAAGYQPKTMLYDNDLPGRLGMVGGRNPKTGALQKGAAQVMVNRGCSPPRIAYWPTEKREKYDVTDWFVEGNDRVGLKTILDGAEMWVPNPDPLAEIEEAEGEIAVDYESENQLLGACVLGGHEVFLTIKPLVGQLDFTQGNARLLYSLMLRLDERGDPIDFGTVRFEAQSLPNAGSITSYMATCMETVPTYAHAEKYATQVALLASRRRAIALARGIAKAAVKGAADQIDFAGLVQQQYERFTERASNTVNLLPMQKLTTEYVNLLLSREAGEFLGIPTGVSKELDEYVAFHAKELTYIAAAPGTGKTSLMKHFQANLGQRGIPSLFVSLEQPAMPLMERFTAAESGINAFTLRRAKWNKDEWESVTAALVRMNDWPVWIIEDAGMTAAKLAVAVSLAKQKHGIKVVFLDYVQIMADEQWGGGGNEAQRIATISRRLAQIARQFDVAMVVASQLNRQGSEPGVMPAMRHMRESGSLEADADMVLGLARKPGEFIVEVGVLKSRSGPSEHRISLFFEPELMLFRDSLLGAAVARPALPAEAEVKQEALDI